MAFQVAYASVAPPRARARGGALPMRLRTHAYAARAAHSSNVWVTPLVYCARVRARRRTSSKTPPGRVRGGGVGKLKQFGTPSNQVRPLQRKSAVSVTSACARHGRLPASCDVLAHATMRAAKEIHRKRVQIKKEFIGIGCKSTEVHRNPGIEGLASAFSRGSSGTFRELEAWAAHSAEVRQGHSRN